MARTSLLKKAVIVLLSVFMMLSILGVNAGDAFAAPKDTPTEQSPKNHVLDSVSYQKVYANPNSNKEEAAFIYAIVTLHPALSKIKYLKEALKTLGLWKAFQAMMNREEAAKKAQGYYIIEKKVYKSKKPTSYYWGYSQTYIFSSVLREKIKGKALTVGKTAY